MRKGRLFDDKVAKVQAAIKMRDGAWPPDAYIYDILDAAEVLDKVRAAIDALQVAAAKPSSTAVIPSRKKRTGAHATDWLTDEEQFQIQKKDLYDRALDGDTTAKKLWFELHGEQQQGLDFNVVVNVTPYRIKDASLKSILMEADKDVVHDALMGLQERLVLDEAPHGMRDALKAFAKAFAIFEERIHAPKDA
jgi:hypothetical protein